MVSNGALIINDELESMSKGSWAIIIHYHKVFLEGRRKTMNVLKQGNSLHTRFKPGTPEYEVLL
jgi:hypothetical protein